MRRNRAIRRVGGGLIVTFAVQAIVVLTPQHTQHDLARPEPSPTRLAVAPPAVAPSVTEVSAEQKLAERIRASLAAQEWDTLSPSLRDLAQSGAPEWRQDRCNTVSPATRAKCTYGPRDGTRTLALLGDSTAISYLPALRSALEPRGWRLHVLTRDQCPAPEVLTWYQTPDNIDTGCYKHRRWAFAQIRELRPDLLVLASSFILVNRVAGVATDDMRRFDQWASRLSSTLRELSPYVTRTVVLGGPPFSGNLRSCVTNVSTPADCVEPVVPEWRFFRDAERRGAGSLATYVDPLPWLCAGYLCPAVIGTTPVQFDGRHLTAAYARSLAPLLRPWLVSCPVGAWRRPRYC